MDQKEIHERATSILSRALELSYDDAIKVIEKECKDNTVLKKEVLSLYKEINSEEESDTEKPSSTAVSRQKTRRIGQKNSELRSRIVHDWTKLLFGNKRNRLIIIIIFLILLAGAGFLSRSFIRNNILESEREEKMALLKANQEILERWIFYEKKKIETVASNADLISFSKVIDSLENLDESNELLRNSQVAREASSWLKDAATWGEYSIVTMLSNSSPKVLLGSGTLDTTGISSMFNTDLGEMIYKNYLKAKNGEIVFIPPINDYDLINDYNLPIAAAVWVNFLCPVKDEHGEVRSIIVGSYPAKNEFSRILQISKHGSTSETYAFNDEGKMLSASRFTNELRQTYLLDFDTTAQTLYKIELKDPEDDVMTGFKPDKKQAQLDYTELTEKALTHLQEKDSIYSGAIMEPYNDYRGIKVIGAYVWLPEYNFGLITEEDADEALASLIYFRYTFVVFYFAILILSFLLYNSNVRIARIGKKVDDFSQLGQYKLRDKLGEGGFGEVYKAEHTFLKTPVAIKILKSEFANTDMLDRFEKEVKITSSLSHPNTIKVYDYGTTENNNFYYVMEYLNGISLDKIVSTDEEMSVARGIYILYHVCLSLKEAHEKGLVHRDIKPMNIMLCNQGGAYDVVKVLDFGLVKDLDTSISQQTQINRIGGTPMFMAPERLRDPFNADQRVDIYAVGAVGLYLFSGQYLLELVSQKMLSGQETLQGDFRNHLIERKDIPQDLSDLLAQCIHFDPEKRPANIDVLIEFLEAKNEEYPWTRKKAMKWWKTYDVYS